MYTIRANGNTIAQVKTLAEAEKAFNDAVHSDKYDVVVVWHDGKQLMIWVWED
jgi:hypothetical protein